MKNVAPMFKRRAGRQLDPGSFKSRIVIVGRLEVLKRETARMISQSATKRRENSPFLSEKSTTLEREGSAQIDDRRNRGTVGETVTAWRVIVNFLEDLQQR